MHQDKQAMDDAPYVRGGTMKRMLAALAFLFGGFTAELARPVNCNLIHRPAARQPLRRQQET
jgi:hypothetical protein